jgi:hypothetical protein
MAIRRRRHIDRVNSFILVWPGDEREQVSFDGEVFYVPPGDEIAETRESRPDSPYKFESARDRQGDLIPGTVRVSDRHAMIEGNRVKVFDADMFVKWIEGIRPDMMDRGLMVVDLPEEVEEAKAEGRPLYEASQDQKARNILEIELFRRKKWEDKGTPAPPSSSEHLVAWAIRHMNERGTALSTIPTDDILGALSTGARRPQDVRTSKKAVATPKDAVAPLDGKTLFGRASELGLNLKKDELAGLLSNDVEVLETVHDRIVEKEAALAEAAEVVDAK